MDRRGLRPRDDEIDWPRDDETFPSLRQRLLRHCGEALPRHCERSAAIHDLPSSAKIIQSPMQPAVYILASHPRGTLYVGVTSDLIARVWQHKSNLAQGFTQKYVVHTLVYFELHATMDNAISREKQLKAGSRAKKVALIEAMNPDWQDLYPGLL